MVARVIIIQDAVSFAIPGCYELLWNGTLPENDVGLVALTVVLILSERYALGSPSRLPPKLCRWICIIYFASILQNRLNWLLIRLLVTKPSTK